MLRHLPFVLLLTLAVVAGVSVGCSGGSSSKKTATAYDAGTAAITPSPLSASPTISALQTLAAAITVLPDGQIVTNGGGAVPPDEAAQAAAAATAPGGGAPGGNPTGAPIETPAAPPSPAATEVPLCVINPVPGCSTTIPVSTPIAPTAQGIVLDSDPTTPGVESGAINSASGQSFPVGINIATVPQPYEGYEWDLIIDGPIAYVKSDEAKPANLSLCSATTRIGPEGANEYYGGCLSTDKNLTYTGTVGTVTLQCTGPGTGQLRLRKQNAGSPFGTDLLNQGAEPITGEVGPPISVVCS